MLNLFQHPDHIRIKTMNKEIPKHLPESLRETVRAGVRDDG